MYQTGKFQVHVVLHINGMDEIYSGMEWQTKDFFPFFGNWQKNLYPSLRLTWKDKQTNLPEIILI